MYKKTCNTYYREFNVWITSQCTEFPRSDRWINWTTHSPTLVAMIRLTVQKLQTFILTCATVADHRKESNTISKNKKTCNSLILKIQILGHLKITKINSKLQISFLYDSTTYRSKGTGWYVFFCHWFWIEFFKSSFIIIILFSLFLASTLDLL